MLHEFLVGIGADVELRPWATLPREEWKQARQGQLGFRNNFDNVTNQYQFLIIRAVPDERDLNFKGVDDFSIKDFHFLDRGSSKQRRHSR